ncbi:hypothetical protein V496_08613 [Pseudogymnoascus sp. VKM F-4515 (FW-2607)]|nr:hypothetical protein V496_08613 [Pseudogymnoascus sp. VKM F-4515 (FW-2607)]KFY78316.1 hypothetical protein V498_09159 [Pseudogymnoascus sp. VKM F-4517 (FW-2822)]
MQATLDQITDIFSSITGRQSPKVKKYLDRVTQNWNKDSFRKHIQCSFPETVVLDSTIQLLWRSFTYYAYHPFPRHEHDVDFAAFTRAVFFLVYRCDELFGTPDFAISDMFFLYTPWRSEGGAADWRRIRIEPLWRSIGTPCSKGSGLDENKTKPVLLDAMDVLCVISPEFVHFGPTPEQLESVARRLLDGAAVRTEITKGDEQTLRRLLERVLVRGEKGGLSGKRYCYGDIAQAGSVGAHDLSSERADEHLLRSDTKEPIYIVGNAIREFNMSDPESRYYQLWAILFQPPMVASGEESSQTMQIAKTEADDNNGTEMEEPRGSVGQNSKDGARVVGNDLKKRIQGFGSS